MGMKPRLDSLPENLPQPGAPLFDLFHEPFDADRRYILSGKRMMNPPRGGNPAYARQYRNSPFLLMTVRSTNVLPL